MRVEIDQHERKKRLYAVRQVMFQKTVAAAIRVFSFHRDGTSCMSYLQPHNHRQQQRSSRITSLTTMATTTSCSVPVCSQAPLGQSCCCCKRCSIGGCDLKVLDCGCCFHTVSRVVYQNLPICGCVIYMQRKAHTLLCIPFHGIQRCFAITEDSPFTACPLCYKPARSILLLPMTFAEIDQAQAEAANSALSDKRGKKRKNATISRLNSMEADGSDLRIGRWTPEETAYCDKLVEHFEQGALPIPDGIKLNDFLASMLKSKHSRLTKKMKNAKLSSKQYKKSLGYILRDEDAREFSVLETEFYASIHCNMERSEIRFHMQKEWREAFSTYCVNIGHVIDANEWLHSAEELDRRNTSHKNAARIARRKVMMGQALREDAINPSIGVFIDPHKTSGKIDPAASLSSHVSDREPEFYGLKKKRSKAYGSKMRPPRHFSSPFIGRVVDYMQRSNVPFEHVDVWVPSFVSQPGASDDDNEGKCRLCFAGCGTADYELPSGESTSVLLSGESQFDLISFGEYSQKFSFDVGCGLPGRVYLTGVSSWEQGIQSAPSGQFERKGGAVQWGIQTVLGVPVPSPNVGRIVIVFYSLLDRIKDELIVSRLSEELAKVSSVKLLICTLLSPILTLFRTADAFSQVETGC